MALTSAPSAHSAPIDIPTLQEYEGHHSWFSKIRGFNHLANVALHADEHHDEDPAHLIDALRRLVHHIHTLSLTLSASRVTPYLLEVATTQFTSFSSVKIREVRGKGAVSVARKLPRPSHAK